MSNLFFVELVTASLDLLASPKFSFEQQVVLLAKFSFVQLELLLAKEVVDRLLSWKEDRWLESLLRLALLFLIFSRELETDLGGNMLSRLDPGSEN